MTTCYQVDNEDFSEGRSNTHKEQKVSAQAKDSPSHFNIEEEVELPEARRIALVKALMDLNIQPNKIGEAKKLEPESQDGAICCATCASITFTYKDLLSGSKPDNRPLFVSGHHHGRIVSKSSHDSRLQSGKAKRIELVIGDLRGGVKKILGDVKPFTEAESYFADVDEDMVSEVILVEVHSTGKAIPRRDGHSKCLTIEENGDKKSKSTLARQIGSSLIDSWKVSIPVLCYVSSSRRKEGQSPFGKEVKPRKLKESDMKFLKETTTMPFAQVQFRRYDFGLSPSPGELNPNVTRERTHGRSEIQKKLKEQSYTIDSARACLDFT
ncbi:hypothetical protein L3X38_042843 [Prunus dulcis]|uniref:Uncharacterized protein n=1 Tax=Prunus dulcis TaxID=3755 RepID=A0AAD4UXQ2_PRUDU|nr:hypothetical protein L3X38_042843 [Prunus dulcis]